MKTAAEGRAMLKSAGATPKSGLGSDIEFIEGERDRRRCPISQAATFKTKVSVSGRDIAARPI
jgi:hypothetical protein